ncbi:MAG: outer membrane protein transport protein [Gammaproteobacteria bacterium]|nr:outer membrane protein transport protein [Gammaproteobacteria bacterium]
MSNRKNILRAAVITALGGSLPVAHATNGDQMLGVTATQWGMAGAVVAAPQDAGTVLTNPAGLATLEMEEFRVDMGFGFLNPPRKANGEESDSDLYMIPSGAMAVRVDDKLTLGMGMAGLSGMGVDFADIMAAAPGNQAVVTTKQFYKIAPGFAYKVNEQLSLGAALNIDYQSLAIHNASFTLPQNQGYGFGASLGMTYKLNEQLQFGASYTSEQDMDAFKWNTSAGSYEMTMNAPQMLQAGVAFTPREDLLIEFDIKQIAFSEVLDSVDFKTPAGMSKMNFGWDDQTVFAIGIQKQLNPKTQVRVGYNYGESPIGPEDVDNNIGSLAVTEQHLSLGLTRQLSKKMYGSFSYVHAFANEITSSTPSGNTIELEQNIVNFQISYRN